MSFIEGEITVEFGGTVGPAGPAGNAVPIAAGTTLANPSGVLANPVGVDAAGMRTLLGLATVATSGSATDLTTGTLPNSRLSTNVVLVGIDTTQRISLNADNGTIDWGLAITGNSRGSLTWDTSKAIVYSPIRLDLQSTTVVLASVTAICNGALIFVPTASTTLSSEGQFCIDRMSNTQIRLKLRGDDSTNRSAILTLS